MFIIPSSKKVEIFGQTSPALIQSTLFLGVGWSGKVLCGAKYSVGVCVVTSKMCVVTRMGEGKAKKIVHYYVDMVCIAAYLLTMGGTR